MESVKTPSIYQDFLRKKILVAGGRGFIGAALCLRLAELGAEVLSLSLRNFSRQSDQEKIEQVVADIGDPGSLDRALSGRSFDYVFNAGGYIDHASFFGGGLRVIHSHYSGVLNLINACGPRIKRFVQIGSSDEYGNQPAPQREDLREAPISPYSAAKTGVTHLIQAMSKTEGYTGVVIRFFLVYGPGQADNRFIPQIIKGCLDGRKFPTSQGRQLRDFCYISDAVDGLLLAALRPEAVGRVINIASGNPVSIREVIEKIVQIVGTGQPEFGAYPYRPGENMRLYADVTLARKLLGWSASISLDEGLRKTIAWYREHRHA